jgi:uncharacterized protein (TIGR02145 family)
MKYDLFLVLMFFETKNQDSIKYSVQMSYTKLILTIFLFIFLITSCRNKSFKTLNVKTSGAELVTDSGGNRINTGSTPDIRVQEKVKDIEGNEYNTIKIGKQTWMVKNLKTTRYNDGTPVALVADSAKWAALSSPAFCWYESDMVSYKPSYGALYNFYAVNTGKLCPKDWHVPSDADWTILTTFLGGEDVAGGKLKEQGASFWVTPNTGANNQSGFTALPGGLRYYDGKFRDFGFSGYWWTSTGYIAERAYFRYMDFEYSTLFRFENSKKIGFSVRCIRDY